MILAGRCSLRLQSWLDGYKALVELCYSWTTQPGSWSKGIFKSYSLLITNELNIHVEKSGGLPSHPPALTSPRFPLPSHIKHAGAPSG